MSRRSPARRGVVPLARSEEEMKSDGEHGRGARWPGEPGSPASWGGADGAQHAPVRAARTRGGGRRVVARGPVCHGPPGGTARRGGGRGGAGAAAAHAAERGGSPAAGRAGALGVGGVLRGGSGQARGRRGGTASGG